MIGLKYNDDTVQKELKHLPYKIENKGNKPVVKVEYQGEEKTFSPEEISSMVLGKMKSIAEDYLGKKLLMPLSLFQLISTMLKDKLLKMPVLLLV